MRAGGPLWGLEEHFAAPQLGHGQSAGRTQVGTGSTGDSSTGNTGNSRIW